MRTVKTVPTIIVPTTLKIAAIAVASIDYSKGEKRGTDSAPIKRKLFTDHRPVYVHKQPVF